MAEARAGKVIPQAPNECAFSDEPKTPKTSRQTIQGNIMMLRHLTKTMTAGALAVTLALTGITATASPASANGHRNNGADAAAVFGGLLLLYGLSQVGRNHGNRNLGGLGQPVNPPVIHHPRPQPQPIYRVAPARCFIQGHDNSGGFRGYRYRCMQQNVTNAYLLPANCLRNVWTDRGQRTIYGARCLANNGWTHG